MPHWHLFFGYKNTSANYQQTKREEKRKEKRNRLTCLTILGSMMEVASATAGLQHPCSLSTVEKKDNLLLLKIFIFLLSKRKKK